MELVRLSAGSPGIEELWAELEAMGLEEVKRKYHQGEWLPATLTRQRVEGWIAFKESKMGNRRALRAEIASGVAILIAILAFVRSC